MRTLVWYSKKYDMFFLSDNRGRVIIPRDDDYFPAYNCHWDYVSRSHVFIGVL